MAASVTAQELGPPSELKWRINSVVLDSSYPTGGYPLSAAALGFTSTKAVIVLGSGGGNAFEFVPNGSDGGHLKVYRNGAAFAAGALPEVVNAASLAGISVQVFVFGV